VEGVTDAVYLIAWTFLGGPPPAPPYPDCGAATDGWDPATGCAESTGSCK
jgi:hypothetical protein